jgi:DNA replication ATP-dependent helicase Dna2
MAGRKAPPFRTSPSAIARYFFHDCERFLYFSSVSPEHRKKLGIPRPAFDHSPLVGAILESGYRWEREVIDTILKGRVVVAPGGGELHGRTLSQEQTLECLRHQPPGRYLYQPTLTPPKAFYDAYNLDPRLVVISENHPDLIEILPDGEGGRLLRVIDLKRGETLKLTHRVQILLYALELQALLEAEGINGVRVDLDQGAVWLGKQTEPEVFALADFRPHLERFLRQDLMRILSGRPQDAEWHLFDRCEWCEFFDHCREEMRQSDDVSRLVQLTTYGKRHLRQEAGVQTLTELGEFLDRADADEVLNRCASLAGQRHRLQKHVEALATDEPQLHGSASPDLPRGENVAVFLTLQREPLGQAIYLAGVLVNVREELRDELLSPAVARQLIGPQGKMQPALWLAERPEDAPAVRRGLILLLDDLFRRLHDYNVRHTEWREQLTLQAYVHTEQERGLLFTALLEALKEPDLAEAAMTLLFHFQGPELIQASRHPTSEVAYPVVVLQNAVSRLLALPVEVSYTLPEMLDALGSSFAYKRRDYFHFPLGHGLRAEALHAAWYRGERGNLEEIERQARHYLQAVSALLRSVREHAAECLFAWPPKFTLPGGAGIRHPVLSRLAFFARYESLLRCLAIREARAEARPTQVLLGQVVELLARTSTEMEVVGDLVVEPEADNFPAWLLVRDSDDGRRAQVEYGDYWYRNKVYGGPDSPHRAVVGVQNVFTEASGQTLLRLTYARNFKEREAKQGERFLLYQRFTDFTTDGLVQFLEETDASVDETPEESTLFLKLLEEPESTATPLSLPPSVRKAADALEDTLGFTPSQREAWQAIRDQRVTAVWGPPGTGKTHFLATTILGLAEAHARGGQPFRVLVTAFTHAAIENLLRKIAQWRGETPGLRVEVLLGKAKYWQGASAGVATVAESDLAGWLTDAEQVSLGATAYSCLKKRQELPQFDLVVIDEASQVRVPEAGIAAMLVAEEGRLVLAGDHLQLPPIVAGVYPETPPDESLLHRSIFEAVCPRPAAGTRRTPAPLAGSRLVRQLLENFRMNDVLTSFAAGLLYGPRYHCGSPAIAARRLAYKPGRGVDPLVKLCLDPAFPLVIVILDGLRSGQANPIEADLVAQLVTALRDGLRGPDGHLYADDRTFFREGVFIVSPHHAQIRAIQQELLRRRTWTVSPFVDTVDKMQGQEADAVVVSYGVADPEFALREAEFIYGLNRLNVAMTRARSKCILCLPRPLLEASPQVLDVEQASAGLGFMRGLVDAVERLGETEVFEGDEVEACVLRVKVPW